jgi:hypothetical protein
MYQVECCICKSWKDKTNSHRWYIPTAEERRELYFAHKKLSHSYCLPCVILKSEIEDGFTPSEIEQIVKEINDEEIKREIKRKDD